MAKGPPSLNTSRHAIWCTPIPVPPGGMVKRNSYSPYKILSNQRIRFPQQNLRCNPGDVLARLGVHLIFERVEDVVSCRSSRALCRLDLLKKRIGNALVANKTKLHAVLDVRQYALECR